MDKPHIAAMEGLAVELRALREQHVNLSEEDDVGLAPIHHAARFGHLECVQFLLSAGVSAVQRSLQRQTPLHYAAQQGHDAVTELLLAAEGVRVGEADHDGWTALHHAAYNGRVSTAALLVRRGADLGAKNQLYCTPLHVACTAGQREVIALLINLGAQMEFAAPLLRPLQMLPLPPAPTEMEDGPLLEPSAVGAALGGLLEDGSAVSALADCTLLARDGQPFRAHVAVLAVRAPALLARLDAVRTASLPELSAPQLVVLLQYLYTGLVGSRLLMSQSASPAELAADTLAVVALLEAARALCLDEAVRAVQRTLMHRVGRGPPPAADGFNADLELLARIVPHAALLDADMRLVLGFFVHSNFAPLLQYHAERSAQGAFPGQERSSFVQALCAVLPVDGKVRVARPSRWRHWGVAPMSEAQRHIMQALVGTVKSDKLANWFVWPVSAIDHGDPTNRKSTIPDYWAACEFPMHLEGVAQRLASNYYVAPEECVSDLRLVFCNAMKYNDESSELWEHAVALYFLVGQLYATNAAALTASGQPSPPPMERGTVDEWVDVTLPSVAERVQRAFRFGHAPDPDALSVDPSNVPAATAAARRAAPPKSRSKSGSKRARKDLKESDWRPMPGGVGGGEGARKRAAPKGASRAVPAHAQQPHALHSPPPPLPLPDVWGRAAPPPPPLHEVPYEEKARLGEDIQRLAEDQIMGLFHIIQQRGASDGVVQGHADEEVELDLNNMSTTTLREVRAYVDACLTRR